MNIFYNFLLALEKVSLFSVWVVTCYWLIEFIQELFGFAFW